jgi:hypothetical protein
VLGMRRWRELVTDRRKMEGYFSTGQSPQRAVLPMEKKNLAIYAVSNRKENSRFRRGVDEFFALLDCNLVYIGSCLQNFEDRLSVPCARVMGLRKPWKCGR